MSVRVMPLVQAKPLSLSISASEPPTHTAAAATTRSSFVLLLCCLRISGCGLGRCRTGTRPVHPTAKKLSQNLPVLESSVGAVHLSMEILSPNSTAVARKRGAAQVQEHALLSENLFLAVIFMLCAEDAYALAAVSKKARAVFKCAHSETAGFFESAVRKVLPCIPTPGLNFAVKPDWVRLYQHYCRRSALERISIKQRSLAAKLHGSVSTKELRSLHKDLDLLVRRREYFEKHREICCEQIAHATASGRDARDYMRRVGLAGWMTYFAKHLPEHLKSVVNLRATTSDELQQMAKKANMRLDAPTTEQVLTALGKHIRLPKAHWCIRSMQVVQLYGVGNRFVDSHMGGSSTHHAVCGVMIHPTTLCVLWWHVEFWEAGDSQNCHGTVFNARVAKSRGKMLDSRLESGYAGSANKATDSLLHFSAHAGYEEDIPNSSTTQFKQAVKDFFGATACSVTQSELDRSTSEMRDFFLDTLSDVRHTIRTII
eukprot:COSAG02_NODE_3500_length_6650_cov_4.876355_7_plen_486_part_00